MDEIKIQVRFSQEGLTDALYFTIDEWDSITQETLELKKKERVDKWKESVQNPPIPPEPTQDQLKEEKEVLLKRIDELDTLIVE